MIDSFKAISLSWKNANLDVRGDISLTDSESKQFLNSMNDVLGISEAMVLSTCNRTEIYYTATKDLSAELIQLLCIKKGISSSKTYLSAFDHFDHNGAIQHLFDVAIGLEAQVVGDMQISNQVKNAYQWSADEDMAGPFLHRLMHTVFFSNKKVVQETGFRDGAASVSYAAVELVEEISTAISKPKILVVGLGEMGRDVAVNLSDIKADNVTICNRTIEKANEIAEQCDYQVLPYEDLWKGIAEADIIISSVSSTEPVITSQKVNELDIVTFKYFVDISVPRSIEKSVEDHTGVVVYNIDSIQNKASQALERRKQAIPQVKDIIASGIGEFSTWSKEMEVSPTIQKLKGALENIRQEEISRYLKNLNEAEVEKVELVTKSIMQKIIKLPVLQLKAACKRGEAETLIDILNDLFNLEQEEVKK